MERGGVCVCVFQYDSYPNSQEKVADVVSGVERFLKYKSGSGHQRRLF